MLLCPAREVDADCDLALVVTTRWDDEANDAQDDANSTTSNQHKRIIVGKSRTNKSGAGRSWNGGAI